MARPAADALRLPWVSVSVDEVATLGMAAVVMVVVWLIRHTATVRKEEEDTTRTQDPESV